MSGDGIEGSDNNTSTVMKMKIGIKNLKDEIVFITIQSNVLSSILINRSYTQIKENLISHRKKQISRQHFGKNKNKNIYDDDDDKDDDH